jgi:hypothetical protein
MSDADFKNNNPSKSSSQRWRAVVVGFLIGVGSIALANWLVLRWMNVYLFNTQNYVETVAPLTKNPEVANAISAYTTQRLYGSIDLEQSIKDALPEKAAFLAAPLTGQIIASTEKIGASIITSDQFNSVWISANQTAHARLMTTLQKPAAEFSSEKDRFVFGVNISPLLERLQQRISSTESVITTNSKLNQAAEIGIALKEKIQVLRAAYQFNQIMYVLLPLLTFAAYLSAIAIAKKRWTVIFSITLALTIIAALELIILKAIRPEIIEQIATSYQAAGGEVWDAFTAGYKTVLTNTLLLGLFTTLITVLAGPFSWAKKLRRFVGIQKLTKTRVYSSLISARKILRDNINIWRVAGVVLAFAVLLIKPNINWQTVAQAILAYIIYVSSVEILAQRR